ncbi:hypothetical protein CIG75_04000 [Tumebacillus algifaecis]|uniref:SH3b domain-containing protein n=1 Tax=Tumebacillus algifaecis TaxID=1214604 RepID=A0A223CYP1_9BACL|nr:hypothetical protein [Tumebacillus algifaecis]ASS74227.1 hypothetical protein CIG75_04000 [Tumebacillus algifaecis]
MMKLLGYFFAIIFVVAMIGSCGDDEAAPTNTEPAKTEPAKTEPAKTEPERTEPEKTEPAKSEQPASESSGIGTGKDGVLKRDVFVGVGETKKNYDEMFDYIVAKNQDALMRMVVDGRVVVATKGTAFTVVNMGFISAMIEIHETGVRGWIPIEYLAQ